MLGFISKVDLYFCILDFINKYNGTFMVLITFVYVVATIAIWIANKRSAEATLEQLDESKRQFEETKRLEYMPCFEIHFDSMDAGTGISVELTDKKTGVVHTLFSKYRIENISKGTALNVKCIMKSAIKRNELIMYPIVPAHNEKSINCLFLADKGYFSEYSLPFSLVIQYNDLMNNLYEQNIELEFLEGTPRWIRVKCISPPQLKNIVD